MRVIARNGFAALIALGCGWALAIAAGFWLASLSWPVTRHTVAIEQLASGDELTAALLFEDPHWQALALFRGGHYIRAAMIYSTGNARYNAATAYAHAGEIERAIGLYESVISEQPEHLDARHNLRVLRATRDQIGQNRQQQSSSERDANGAASAASSPNAVDGADGSDGQSGDEKENLQVIKEHKAKAESMQANSADSSSGDGLGAQASGGGDQQAISAPDNISGGGTDPGRESVLGKPPGDEAMLAVRDNDNPGAESGSQPLAPAADMRLQESDLADDVLLRRIIDDPAVVLRARFNSAQRQRAAGDSATQ